MLKIIGIPRSTYYYQKNDQVEEKKVSEGRPAPNYSLQRAWLKRQQFDRLEKPVIRTDNGPQFISHTFEKFCENYKIEY